MGRDALLKRLHSQLQGNERIGITGVRGMGGVGKTELALQYAISSFNQNIYPGGVCWLYVRDQQIATQIVNFAMVHLGLNPPNEFGEKEKIAYIWQHWPPGDSLIVFDDVDTYKLINQYIPPPNLRFKILATTRNYLDASIIDIEINPLLKKDAVNLFQSIIKDAEISYSDYQVENICQILGNLPLAIEIVGRYLAYYSIISLEDVLKNIRKFKLKANELSHSEVIMTSKMSLYDTFLLSWESLTQSQKLILLIINKIYSSLRRIDYIREKFHLFFRDETFIKDIDILEHLSLLKKIDEKYIIHKLTEDFIDSKYDETWLKKIICNNQSLSRFLFMHENNLSTYNVVLVGMTGVGKSSLINYLYEKKVAETGIGKPVTRIGFHEYNFSINNMPVSLFDSWGIEVGKEEIWQLKLEEELSKRGVDKPAEEWFHSVFYCISAGSHRLQDFDEKVINKFLEQKYNLCILLTKADLINTNDENTLIKSIKKCLPKAYDIPIISVCSEEYVTRRGDKTEKWGKKQIELSSYKIFWKSVSLRLPSRCKSVIYDEIDKWRKQQVDIIENKINEIRDKSIFKNQELLSILIAEFNQDFSEIYETLTVNVQEFSKDLTRPKGIAINLIYDEIERTLELFQGFSEYLDYPPDNSEYNDITVKDEPEKLKLQKRISIEDLVHIFQDVRHDLDSYKSMLEEIFLELEYLMRFDYYDKKKQIVNELDSVINIIKNKSLKGIEDVAKKILHDIYLD